MLWVYFSVLWFSSSKNIKMLFTQNKINLKVYELINLKRAVNGNEIIK